MSNQADGPQLPQPFYFVMAYHPTMGVEVCIPPTIGRTPKEAREKFRALVGTPPGYGYVFSRISRRETVEVDEQGVPTATGQIQVYDLLAKIPKED